MPLGADDEDTGAVPRASPARSGATSPPRPAVPSVLTKKEADVYEAETRVGSMPAAILDALREQGLDERDPEHRPTAPPPRASTNAPPGPIPRAYVMDASDDDDKDVATRVHRDGKKVALGSAVPTPDREVITSPALTAPPRPAPPLPQLGGTLPLSAKPPSPPATADSPTQTAPALPVPMQQAQQQQQPQQHQHQHQQQPPPPQPFAPPPPPAPQPTFAPGANGAFPMNPTYPPPFAPQAPSHASFGLEPGPVRPVSNKHWILIVALSFVITLAVLGVVISRLL